MKDALGEVQSVLVLGEARRTSRWRQSAGSSGAGRRESCSRRASPRRATRRPRICAPPARPRSTRVAFDGTDFASHETFVNAIFDRFGDFDLVLVAFGVLGDQDRAEHDPAAALEIVQTNFTGTVSVTVPLAARLRTPGPRHTGAPLVGRGRARPPLELRLRGIEGRYRRLLPGPRGVARDERRTRDDRPARLRAHEDDQGHEGRAALGHAPTRSPTRSCAGIAHGRDIVWVPPALRYVMAGLRHLPTASLPAPSRLSVLT